MEKQAQGLDLSKEIMLWEIQGMALYLYLSQTNIQHPKKLPLKFGQNRVNNSWYIADIELVWGGIYSHFCIQPPTTVEVML